MFGCRRYRRRLRHKTRRGRGYIGSRGKQKSKIMNNNFVHWYIYIRKIRQVYNVVHTKHRLHFLLPTGCLRQKWTIKEEQGFLLTPPFENLEGHKSCIFPRQTPTLQCHCQLVWRSHVKFERTILYQNGRPHVLPRL